MQHITSTCKFNIRIFLADNLYQFTKFLLKQQLIPFYLKEFTEELYLNNANFH